MGGERESEAQEQIRCSQRSVHYMRKFFKFGSSSGLASQLVNKTLNSEAPELWYITKENPGIQLLTLTLFIVF